MVAERAQKRYLSRYDIGSDLTEGQAMSFGGALQAVTRLGSGLAEINCGSFIPTNWLAKVMRRPSIFFGV
jgi:hypothetical protein